MITIIVSLLAVCFTSLRESNGHAIVQDIYNGNTAVLGQFPYQVLLQQISSSGASSVCGGSIISNMWILTAAHCSYGSVLTKVYPGVVNSEVLSEDPDPGIMIFKKNHYIHEQYNPTTLQNDIALLKLPTPLNFTENVATIALPTKSQAPVQTFANQMATISGWGLTKNNGEVSGSLQFNTVKTMTNAACASYYQDVGLLTSTMLCTEKQTVNSGPCQGDSGGPLTVNGTNSKPVLIGAVSWGVGECTDRNPVVYVNVAYYLPWIYRKSGIIVS